MPRPGFDTIGHDYIQKEFISGMGLDKTQLIATDSTPITWGLNIQNVTVCECDATLFRSREALTNKERRTNNKRQKVMCDKDTALRSWNQPQILSKIYVMFELAKL